MPNTTVTGSFSEPGLGVVFTPGSCMRHFPFSFPAILLARLFT